MPAAVYLGPMPDTWTHRLSSNPFPGENRTDHPDLGRIPAILLGLGLFQIVSMVGSTSLFLVGSLLLVDLTGGAARWAGLPTAVILVSSAVAAWPLASWKGRIGYRLLLLFSALTGVLGGLVAMVGATLGSIGWIVVACVLVGVANAGIALGRYAAAELAPMRGRGRAMSVVMTSSTVGALGAPVLANLAVELAKSAGWTARPEAGAFALAALAYALAGIVGSLLVSREPVAIAKLADWKVPEAAPGATPIEPTGTARLVASIGSLVFAQMAMVFLMSVTPADMKHCHHPMGEITAVLTVHFLGMFGLSFLTGQLVDRFGRLRTIALGSLVLAVSCLLGFAWTDLAGRLVSLFLLGLGWNFCFLAGSVLVADALRAGNKARLQGGADALVALSSSAASLSAGLALQSFGFGVLTFVGLALSLAPMGFLVALRRRG